MSSNEGHFVLQSGGDITYLGPFQQIKSIQTTYIEVLKSMTKPFLRPIDPMTVHASNTNNCYVFNPPLGKLKEIAQVNRQK